MSPCAADETSSAGFHHARMERFMSATTRMGHAQGSLCNDPVKAGQPRVPPVNALNHSSQYPLSKAKQQTSKIYLYIFILLSPGAAGACDRCHILQLSLSLGSAVKPHSDL